MSTGLACDDDDDDDDSLGQEDRMQSQPRITMTYQTGHFALHRRARLQPGELLLVARRRRRSRQRCDPAARRRGK
jgi:hypothetical protein